MSGSLSEFCARKDKRMEAILGFGSEATAKGTVTESGVVWRSCRFETRWGRGQRGSPDRRRQPIKLRLGRLMT